jgi:hypothetical protein
MLVIQNKDNSTIFIPEEIASDSEKLIIEEFRKTYPNGKPVVTYLDDAKALKIQEMSDECKRQIIYEFYSDYLGNRDKSGNLIKDHYDCTDEDQRFIQGLANKATLIAGGAATDGVLDWKRSGEPICYPFPIQCCMKLGLDMFDHITTTRKRFEAIRRYILEGMDEEDTVVSVTWDITIPDKYFENPNTSQTQ